MRSEGGPSAWSWRSANKDSYKAAKWAKKYGVRLRPDLYAHLKGVRSTHESEKLEQELAAKLRSEGYCIRAGPPRA